jgi:hypothetical protein
MNRVSSKTIIEKEVVFKRSAGNAAWSAVIRDGMLSRVWCGGESSSKDMADFLNKNLEDYIEFLTEIKKIIDEFKVVDRMEGKE